MGHERLLRRWSVGGHPGARRPLLIAPRWSVPPSVRQSRPANPSGTGVGRPAPRYARTTITAALQRNLAGTQSVADQLAAARERYKRALVVRHGREPSAGDLRDWTGHAATRTADLRRAAPRQAAATSLRPRARRPPSRGGRARTAGVSGQPAFNALLRATHRRSRADDGRPGEGAAGVGCRAAADGSRPRCGTSPATTVRPARPCGGCSTARLSSRCSCATSARSPAMRSWATRPTTRSTGRLPRRDAWSRPGHRVRLEPGGLRHELPVLRDRPSGPHAQPVDRRDRRADRRRRANSRRAAKCQADQAESRTWSSWAWVSRSPITMRWWARCAG